MLPFYRLDFYTTAIRESLEYWPLATISGLAWAILDQYIQVMSQATAQINATLAAFAATAFFIDTAVGVYFAFADEDKQFETSVFAKFFDKVVKYAITYGIVFMIAEGSREIPVLGEVVPYFSEITLFAILLREGSSISENIWGKTLDVLIGSWTSSVSSIQETISDLE